MISICSKQRGRLCTALRRDQPPRSRGTVTFSAADQRRQQVELLKHEADVLPAKGHLAAIRQLRPDRSPARSFRRRSGRECPPRPTTAWSCRSRWGPTSSVSSPDRRPGPRRAGPAPASCRCRNSWSRSRQERPAMLVDPSGISRASSGQPWKRRPQVPAADTLRMPEQCGQNRRSTITAARRDTLDTGTSHGIEKTP